MECYTYLRNIQDLLSDGKTPYERRFGEPFKGHSVWFIGWVSPSQESINLERKSYLDCSSNTLLYAGGIWKGDVMVADIEELETVDASEIYSKRLNAKEVIFPKQNGKFIFQPQMDE